MRNYSKKITFSQGLYVKYRLKCVGCSGADVAREIGCTRQMLDKVLSGKGHSHLVERVVAHRLGYPSWNEMVEHLRKEALT